MVGVRFMVDWILLSGSLVDFHTSLNQRTIPDRPDVLQELVFVPQAVVLGGKKEHSHEEIVDFPLLLSENSLEVSGFGSFLLSINSSMNNLLFGVVDGLTNKRRLEHVCGEGGQLLGESRRTGALSGLGHDLGLLDSRPHGRITLHVGRVRAAGHVQFVVVVPVLLVEVLVVVHMVCLVVLRVVRYVRGVRVVAS